MAEYVWLHHRGYVIVMQEESDVLLILLSNSTRNSLTIAQQLF